MPDLVSLQISLLYSRGAPGNPDLRSPDRRSAVIWTRHDPTRSRWSLSCEQWLIMTAGEIIRRSHTNSLLFWWESVSVFCMDGTVRLTIPFFWLRICFRKKLIAHCVSLPLFKGCFIVLCPRMQKTVILQFPLDSAFCTYVHSQQLFTELQERSPKAFDFLLIVC